MARTNHLRLKRSLRLVPGLGARRSPWAVRCVHRGLLNEVWRVDTVAGSYALRLPSEPHTALGANHARELQLQRAAAAHGLAPEVCEADTRSGTVVSVWCAGRTWRSADFDSPRRIAQLLELIAALQRLPVPRSPRFAAARLAARYAASARVRGTLPASVAARWRRVVSRAARMLAAKRAAPVVVHGDLHAGNLVGFRRPRLLDFEYAQFGHPALDYGGLLARFPGAVRLRRAVLGLEQWRTRRGREELQAAERLYAAMDRLWRAAVAR